MAESSSLQVDLQAVNMKYPSLLNHRELRFHQKTIIESILAGQNVFASLPTGYGKTLTYVLPSLILDERHPAIEHTTLIISPLLSLMREQALYLNEAGIKSVCVSSEMTDADEKDLYTGKAKMILTTPEAASVSKFRKELRRVYSKRLSLISVDETHLVSAWGETFRQTYRRLPELSALFRTPFIFVTATATQTIQDDVLDLFNMKDAHIVTVLPDRPDIRLDVHGGAHSFALLDWAIDRVRTQGSDALKTVIFTSSIKETSELYEHTMEVLEDQAFKGGSWRAHDRYVEMYHSGVSNEREDYIMETFRKENSIVRLLLATIRLGMGIDIPDIDCIIVFGAPTTILDLWQELGRCARRSDLAGHGVVYLTKLSLRDNEDEHIQELAHAKGCKRDKILQAFTSNPSTQESPPHILECDMLCPVACQCSLCRCCNFCASKCKCQTKDSRSFCAPKK